MSTRATLVVAAVILAFVGQRTVAGQPLAAQPPPTQPAATQPPSAQPASPSSPFSPYPLGVQLSTVVDHPAQFAGLLVQLRTARVTRIVSGTLVELKDAREFGPYHFHVFYKPDALLAVLPAGARVSKGDEIIVAGTLRTVRGATVSQEMAGTGAEAVKEHGNKPVLVVTTATTIEGASLANAR